MVGSAGFEPAITNVLTQDASRGSHVDQATPRPRHGSTLLASNANVGALELSNSFIAFLASDRESVANEHYRRLQPLVGKHQLIESPDD